MPDEPDTNDSTAAEPATEDDEQARWNAGRNDRLLRWITAEPGRYL